MTTRTKEEEQEEERVEEREEELETWSTTKCPRQSADLAETAADTVGKELAAFELVGGPVVVAAAAAAAAVVVVIELRH